MFDSTKATKKSRRRALLCIALKRKKSWDDEGVAATVGTILSLMVFLTFLGMFTNQYVPVWMKENENNHMNTVIGQLSSLKAGVDMQILTTQSSNLASAPLYTPVQLEAAGIPVFASPTAGQLALTIESKGYPSSSLVYNYTVGTGASMKYYQLNGSNGGKTGGSLEFKGENRYYVQQVISYENGAIVLNQTKGEIILSGISVRIVNYSDSIMMSVTQISLTGLNKTVGGFGTKGVSTSLQFASYQKYVNASKATMSMTIITKYGTAWQKYFTDLRSLSNTGIPISNWNIRMSSFVVDTQTYYTVIMSITGINSLEYTKASVSMTMADIGI